MGPQMNQALQEAYARRAGGATMPQSGQPAAPAMQQPQSDQPTAPAMQQPQSGYSGGAEGVPTSQGPQIDPEHEIQMLAAKALAKRLNSAGKVA